MKKKLFFIGWVIISIQTQAIAQQSRLDLSQKKFNQLAYSESIKIYEDLAKDGYKSKELLENLANAYYFKADFEPAKRWYDSLFIFTNMLSADTYSKYVSTLKTQNEYEKADKVMNQMGELYPNDTRFILYNKNKEYLKNNKKSPSTAEVINAGFNSNKSDFSPAFLGDSIIVFSSARNTKNILEKKHNWTGEPFIDLYYSIKLSKKGSQKKDSTSIPNQLKYTKI